MKKHKILKTHLLLGTSVLTLGFSNLNTANAHTQTRSCTGTVAATCYAHDGVTKVTGADINQYCLRDGVEYDPSGAKRTNFDPRVTCTYTCSVPHTHRSSGSGGGGGYSGGGDWSDADNDGVDDRGDLNNRDPSIGNQHGGGGGGGGGTVICTYLHNKKIMTDAEYYSGFSYSIRKAHPITWRGYHFWAIPTVKHMRNNPNSFIEKIMIELFSHRAKDIMYQMGMSNKSDYLGRFYTLIFASISFGIGLFVEQKDFNELYTSKDIKNNILNFKNYHEIERLKLSLLNSKTIKQNQTLSLIAI